MTFTFDVSTEIGKVRLLIPDRSSENHLFEDDEIQVFIDLEGGVKGAAALGIETIASDQAMVLKVIKTLDLSTDGAKTSDALLARAKLLRDQAETDDDLDYAGFEIADMVYDDFSSRELILKDALDG